jgi:hypothetical protein
MHYEGCRQGRRLGRGVNAMHLVKEHIFELAQEGAKLSNEEQLHLKQCEECGSLYRVFVLQRFYTEQTFEQPLSEYLRSIS